MLNGSAENEPADVQPPRILHLVLNSFTHDARVMRSATTGVEMGAEVCVFALHTDGLPVEEWRDGVRIRRFRISTRRLSRRLAGGLAVKYVETFGRLIAAAVHWQPDLVHAHDLAMLPIGSVASRLCSARLIYDSHELWSDASHRASLPAWIYRAGIALEGWLARRSDAVITVSDGVAQEMSARLGVSKPFVIRNVPTRWPPSEEYDRSGGRPLLLRRTLGIPGDNPVLLYQGGIARGRGVTTLLEAMPCITSRAVLVLLGGRSGDPLFAETVQADRFAGRVHILDAVPPEELPFWTSDATIGVCPIEDICLSYRHSLPNKLFEYLQGGMPVIVSDLPDMKLLVQEYDVGRVVTPGDPRALAEAVNQLLGDERELIRLRDNARTAARTLNWDVEGQRLRAIYAPLLASRK